MPDRQLIFIGPLPPVVNGQSIATRYLMEKLQSDGLVLTVIDTNTAGARVLTRVLNGLMRTLKVLFCVLKRKNDVAYISVNANLGMLLTALIALCAKFRGHLIILHHHTRSHIEPGNWRLALLVKAAGVDAVHISICSTMSRDLQDSSTSVDRVLSFSNVGVVDESIRKLELKQPLSEEPRVLGIFGNLTNEKGLSRAIDAFVRAKDKGLAKKLVLAGPVVGDAENLRVKEAVQEFGESIELMGPLYGNNKLKFFNKVDVFLFPSLYPNETQGIVNLEALAAGLPVLAFAVCCTPEDLQGSACKTVAVDADFSQATCDFLTSLPSHAREAARERFDTLKALNFTEYDLLKDLILLGKTTDD